MKKRKKIDWCQYFHKIEEDPTAMTPTITGREFQEAEEHVMGCDSCFNITERVLAKAPKQQFPKRELN